jgi:hypothetical protein
LSIFWNFPIVKFSFKSTISPEHLMTFCWWIQKPSFSESFSRKNGRIPSLQWFYDPNQIIGFPSDSKDMKFYEEANWTNKPLPKLRIAKGKFWQYLLEYQGQWKCSIFPPKL